MPLRRPFAMLVPLLAIALATVSTTPAQAQLLGPVQGLPNVQVPGVGLPGMVPASPLRSVDDLLRGPLALTRKLQIDALRRSEPRRVDVDPHGAPILRGEFLATGLSAAQRDAVQAQGFVVDRATPADATLGLDFVVLHDTRGRSTASAMRALRQAAPDAAFTYQHLYLPAGEGDVAGATTAGR